MTRTDRIIGTLAGMAAGDVLGAGYEFGPALPDDTVVEMKGGGAFDWEPGEWTDDTSMAVPIARALGRGESLADPATLGLIVEEWRVWAQTALDVGNQTRAVLGALPRGGRASEQDARGAAERVHRAQGRSGGNGSLMRTAPVALGYLDDPSGLALAARRVSDPTHYDPEAGDACVLWSLAIRRAIVDGVLDIGKRGAND